MTDWLVRRPLGETARSLVEEKYSLDVAVPDLRSYFERIVSTGGRIAREG